MKNLWFILLASIILLGILFSPKQKPSFEVIAAEVSLGNEILEQENNQIVNVIKKEVKLFPQSKIYLTKTDTIHQIVKQEMKTQNIDFEAVMPKLIKMVDDVKDAEQLKFNLFYGNFETVTHQPLKIALAESNLLQSESTLFNYFAKKTGGIVCGYFPIECIGLNTRNIICLGEQVNWEYVMSSYSFSDFKFLLNNEPLILDKERPYKSEFKLKPTTIGKNTFEITIEGRNKEGNYEKVTREFEFWVE